MATKRKVVVTTEFRGVFFGHLEEDNAPAYVRLSNSRNCIYWHKSIGGFGGLLSDGPNTNCRIGAVIPEITIYKIASIGDVSPLAAKNWKEAKTCS